MLQGLALEPPKPEEWSIPIHVLLTAEPMSTTAELPLKTVELGARIPLMSPVQGKEPPIVVRLPEATTRLGAMREHGRAVHEPHSLHEPILGRERQHLEKTAIILIGCSKGLRRPQGSRQRLLDKIPGLITIIATIGHSLATIIIAGLPLLLREVAILLRVGPAVRVQVRPGVLQEAEVERDNLRQERKTISL